jgi:hypothetical protein
MAAAGPCAELQQLKRQYESALRIWAPYEFPLHDEPEGKLHGYSATSFTSPLEVLAAARSMAPNLLISERVLSSEQRLMELNADMDGS